MSSQNWFERKILNSVRKRLAKRASYPAVVRHFEATFVLDPANWIDNRLIAKIPFEVRQIERAKALISQHGIDLFIDIGANFGLYTILLGRMEAISKVIAIEPMRRNYNQLLANVFANRLDGKVSARQCAISQTTGTATLYIDPQSTGLSRLDLAGSHRDASVFRDSEEIATAHFDETYPMTSQNVFVKIDVEGHALKVVSTMGVFLDQNNAILQIELFETEKEDVSDFLGSHGYVEIDEIEGDYYFMPSLV